MRNYFKCVRYFFAAGVVACAVMFDAVCGTGAARAEGYQVNSLSARQLGMGYTGVALRLGSESILYNPGALSFMNRKFEVSAGVTGIMSKVKYESVDGIYKAETDNPVSSPFFVYFGYKPFERLSFGLGINTPAGNSIKWPDNWRGSELIESIDLKAFCFQPTVSFKVTDFLSIGAGLMVDFGSVDLSRALVAAGGLDRLAALAPLAPQLNITEALAAIEGMNPVGARLKGTSKIAYGVNVGALVNVTPKLSVGLSYRSMMRLKVSGGEAELKYASEDIEKIIGAVNGLRPGAVPIPPINEGKFEASVPVPSNINAGVSYKFNDKWLVSGELQFVGWKAYDSLKFQFDEKVLNGYSTVAPKKYKNTVIYKVGAECNVSELATLRVGGYYDTTPVRDNLYNPETPGSNKKAFTAGASLRPMKGLSVDLGLCYIYGNRRYGAYKDAVTHSDRPFEGYYKASAWLGSVGLSYAF